MNELILPIKINVKIGKTTHRHELGDIIVKAKYKTGLVLGLCWLSVKIFFMAIKRLIGC